MKKITISIPTLPMGSLKRPKIFIPLILIAGMLLGVAGFISYQNLKNQFPAAPKEEVNPDAPPQEVLGLVESVAKHISDVPSNELPNVATVSDLAKLSDQAFFEGAQVGDKVLIYTAAKRAFLYRPSTDTIIKSGAVEFVTTDTKPASKNPNATDSAVLRVKY